MLGMPLLEAVVVVVVAVAVVTFPRSRASSYGWSTRRSVLKTRPDDFLPRSSRVTL